MTQSVLNRAIARATGETVERVQRMGFSLVEVPPARPLPIPLSLRRVRSLRRVPRPGMHNTPALAAASA